MSIRIISGAARGRRLQVPADGVRPTSERARAALFDRLDTTMDLAGARVLDLFAGSGAVGLEALSRRASHVWFVENDPRAVEVVRANVGAVTTPGSGVSGVARVLRDSVQTVLRGTGPDRPFDLVFADPPYDLPEEELSGVLELVAGPLWTSAGSAVVVERATRGPGPSWPTCIEPVASKRYGEGTLWYGRIG